MPTLTMEKLRQLLAECGGDTEFDGTIDHVPFESLGYDSLALLEASAKIKEQYGVEVPDDDIALGATPAQLLSTVNRHLTVG